MPRMLVLAAVLAAVAGCAEICGPGGKSSAAGGGAGNEPPIPPLVALPPPGVPETDVFAMLAPQRGGQPSLQDVAVAARYYCSTRAKLSQFVAQERPPELLRQAMPNYDLVTYRCVEPPQSN